MLVSANKLIVYIYNDPNMILLSESIHRDCGESQSILDSCLLYIDRFRSVWTFQCEMIDTAVRASKDHTYVLESR